MVKKLFLVGNKFLSKTHYKQSAFAYSAWEPFSKNKE